MNTKTIGIIIFSIIGIIILAIVSGAIGPSIASSNNTQTCKNPGKTNVIIHGIFSVRDGSLIGVEPEINKIESIGIDTNPLGIFTTQEPFNIEVVAVDGNTNKELDTFKTTGVLSSDQKTSTHRFDLNYRVVDADCDKEVDDHDVDITIKIKETKDLSEDTDSKTFSYKIQNGKIVQ